MYKNESDGTGENPDHRKNGLLLFVRQKEGS